MVWFACLLFYNYYNTCNKKVKNFFVNFLCNLIILCPAAAQVFRCETAVLLHYNRPAGKIQHKTGNQSNLSQNLLDFTSYWDYNSNIRRISLFCRIYEGGFP